MDDTRGGHVTRAHTNISIGKHLQYSGGNITSHFHTHAIVDVVIAYNT